jgi:hypothetical protein
MKHLRLVRVSEYKGSTMGVLCINDIPEFVTLEDAWRNNERMISCIPTGEYKIRQRNSPKFGRTYRVEDVPGRSHILFHAGNTHEDTHGCILLGMQFGKIKGEPAILSSRTAFSSFMQMMIGVSEAELVIVDSCGGRCVV